MLEARTETVDTNYGDEQAEMADYLRAGEKRALALGNRGPMRFNADGSLAEEILKAYWRCGFYVFTGVFEKSELADIEADVNDILERASASEGALFDAQGQPAADAPEKVIFLVLGSLQFSEACLRVYGHSGLLPVAAAIHGPDFTPFNEALFIKQPGLGSSVARYQDGVTHWDSPDFDQGTHDFNFMAQLYGSTAANGLWLVPGIHKHGKLDIKAMADEAGTDRLPDAVPMLCDAGDVGICNRQTLHGSFANTSPDTRATVNFGFHRRSSVLGVKAGGVHNATMRPASTNGHA